MEPDLSNESLCAKQVVPFAAPVSILVTSYRYKLCDSDGVSAKAIIDGLVHCGVLQDDSPKFVEEVRYRQIKVKNKSDEKTVVTIEEC